MAKSDAWSFADDAKDRATRPSRLIMVGYWHFSDIANQANVRFAAAGSTGRSHKVSF
jgi:hypothetical protein